MTYQLIYLLMITLSLGMTFAKHGEPKTGKENGWITLITAGVVLFILYKGGFFNPLLS